MTPAPMTPRRNREAIRSRGNDVIPGSPAAANVTGLTELHEGHSSDRYDHIVIVGVPREIKISEERVALTPAGARAFTEAGHQVLIEPGAGAGSGIRDDEYERAGARPSDVDALWRQAELVLKVKEPQPEEVARIRPGQTLFTYLHLAPAPPLIRALQARGGIAIGYETVERAGGSPPPLTPISEVAGRPA